MRVLAENSEVLAIVDDRLSKIQEKLFGVPVIDTEAWISKINADRSIISCILVPTSPATNHFIRQCIQHNFNYLSPLQYLGLLKKQNISTAGLAGRLFNYGYNFYENALNNIEELLSLESVFSDEYSKISFLSMLLYRLTLNPTWLDRVVVGHGSDYGYNSYCTNKSFFKFSDNEVYVDGGAYTGDTIERFIRSVDGKFKHIFSFEPSSFNNNEIRKRLRILQDEFLKPLKPSISLIEKGLWSSETELSFNSNGSLEDDNVIITPLAAHFVESGMVNHIYEDNSSSNSLNKLPVTTLDEATGGRATFIKLEIEGSELHALNGAKETIKMNRPKMAISIYHKPEDLIELINFVIETGQGYKLGFRQHSPFVPDATVLYCS
jgi:FkbM family methyltransferase